MKHRCEPDQRTARQPRCSRRRTPLIVWILAAIGLLTLAVLALRYVFVPLLVLLEGVV